MADQPDTQTQTDFIDTAPNGAGAGMGILFGLRRISRTFGRRILGKALGAAGAIGLGGLEIYQGIKDGRGWEATKKVAAQVVGGVGGAWVGGAVGSIFGPPGTFVGAMAGGFLGSTLIPYVVNWAGNNPTTIGYYAAAAINYGSKALNYLGEGASSLAKSLGLDTKPDSVNKPGTTHSESSNQNPNSSNQNGATPGSADAKKDIPLPDDVFTNDDPANVKAVDATMYALGVPKPGDADRAKLAELLKPAQETTLNRYIENLAAKRKAKGSALTQGEVSDAAGEAVNQNNDIIMVQNSADKKAFEAAAPAFVQYLKDHPAASPHADNAPADTKNPDTKTETGTKTAVTTTPASGVTTDTKTEPSKPGPSVNSDEMARQLNLAELDRVKKVYVQQHGDYHQMSPASYPTVSPSAMPQVDFGAGGGGSGFAGGYSARLGDHASMANQVAQITVTADKYPGPNPGGTTRTTQDGKIDWNRGNSYG